VATQEGNEVASVAHDADASNPFGHRQHETVQSLCFGRVVYLFRTTGAMSDIGTKQTLASAMQMSAFGGKADLALGMFYEYTP
jgi:hypothetical protein